jgi:hypothetical protein
MEGAHPNRMRNFYTPLYSQLFNPAQQHCGRHELQYRGSDDRVLTAPDKVLLLDALAL